MTGILVGSDSVSALLRVRAGLRRLTRAASTPAILVLLVYGVWLLAMLSSGHDVRDFVHMGRRYVFARHAVPLFTPDPTYRYATKSNGYDGQFAFYIAVAPVDARLHLDRVNYRYTRIVYPMTARLLSWGQAELVPYALIMVNWLAIAAGTYVVGLWLKRRAVTPWPALVYGLSPGLFVCLQRDLEEPLAYALVALAVFVYSDANGTQSESRDSEAHGPPGEQVRGPALTGSLQPVGSGRAVVSGIIFAFAVLTRESVAIFPLVLALVAIFTRNTSAVPAVRWGRLRAAAFVLLPALLPFLLYKAFLLYWLSVNTEAFPPALLPRLEPFGGLTSYWPWRNHQVEVIIGVVAPSLVCAGMGAWAVWKRRSSPEVWFMLANVLVFVVMLNRLSYENFYAAGRIATGVILAAVLSIPTFDRQTGRDRLWLSFCALLWFLPWPMLVLFVEQVPLTRALLLELAIALILWAVTAGGFRAANTIAVQRRRAL
jgi:hypothetical protein